jgi:LacI family transcriptional regulator
VNVTLADIAEATTTSISTVSRVLSGGPVSQRISQQTRQRVLDAASRLGYRPNLVARSLRTRRTHTVALMVSDIANPWFGRLASHIEQHLHRGGYSLMLCNSCEDGKLEREYLQLLPLKGIDGLILIPLATTRAALSTGLGRSLPLVVVDRPIHGASSVSSDSEQSAAILCDRLTAAGVRRIGLVRGPSLIVTHRQRAEAISKRFEVVSVHEGPAQPETGREAWVKARSLSIDAIVCTNNFLGQGVIEAMSDQRDFRPVACFDEIPMMHLLPLPIVCNIQDVPRLAEESVRLMIAQLSGAETPVSNVVVPSSTISNTLFDRLLESRR